MVKNINSTHRIEGVPTQFGLAGAREASIQNVGGGKLLTAAVEKE